MRQTSSQAPTGSGTQVATRAKTTPSIMRAPTGYPSSWSVRTARGAAGSLTSSRSTRVAEPQRGVKFASPHAEEMTATMLRCRNSPSG